MTCHVLFISATAQLKDLGHKHPSTAENKTIRNFLNSFQEIFLRAYTAEGDFRVVEYRVTVFYQICLSLCVWYDWYSHFSGRLITGKYRARDHAEANVFIYHGRCVRSFISGPKRAGAQVLQNVAVVVTCTRCRRRAVTVD